jgi:hypothetical protein
VEQSFLEERHGMRGLRAIHKPKTLAQELPTTGRHSSLGDDRFAAEECPMLRTLEDLMRARIGAVDGTIGHIKDAYFEDQNWTVRYLVADTARWLSRKVLISPFAVEAAHWDEARIDVRMTREQVKNSPDIDTDKPVSRQHEMLHLNYYGFPYYWGGPMLWGPTAYPGIAETCAPILCVRGLGQSSCQKIRTRAIRTCAAANPSPAIVSKRLTATSAISTIIFSAMKIGRSAT